MTLKHLLCRCFHEIDRESTFGYNRLKVLLFFCILEKNSKNCHDVLQSHGRVKYLSVRRY